MRIYYRATAEDGQVHDGEVDAASRLEVLRDLAARGWHVDYCESRRPSVRALRPADLSGKAVIFPELLALRPWPGHLANFYHQLGQLLAAGVTPHEAAVALAERAPTARLRQVMAALAPELAAGGSLAEGLARYPQLFPPDTAGLLCAAERSGDWEGICAELTEWYTRIYRGMLWILVARVYYAFVLLLTALVPFFPLFISKGLTWYLIFVATRIAPVLAGVLFLWLAWRVVWALPGMRPLRDRLVLFVPFGRGYEMRAAGLRLFRAMHSLIHAGVGAGEALSLAAEATGNVVLAASARRAAESVRRGGRVEDVARDLPFLTGEQRAVLATAFQSGRLDQGLARLAEDARDQMTTKLWAARMASAGTAIAIVTLLAAVAVGFAYYNYVSALIEKVGTWTNGGN
jgi:type II secretory pathway component PulF